MTSNNVNNLAERAMIGLLQTELAGTIITPEKVYVSDPSETKSDHPSVVVFATEKTEIAPGCGIYNLKVTVRFTSHTETATQEERETVMVGINNVAYTALATNLSLYEGFHCHGAMVEGGSLQTPDADAYEYTLEMNLACMPMNGP